MVHHRVGDDCPEKSPRAPRLFPLASAINLPTHQPHTTHHTTPHHTTTQGGELFSSQGHLGAALVGAHPALANKPSMRVEGACASGGLAFACALDAIQAGSAKSP